MVIEMYSAPQATEAASVEPLMILIVKDFIKLGIY